MQFRLTIFATTLAWMLAACTASPSPHATDSQERSSMHVPSPSSSSAAPPASSPRTAADLLKGLLVLFRKTRSADDFTPQVVGDAMGVPMRRFSPYEFGEGGQLTPQWRWRVEVTSKPSKYAPRLSFQFAPASHLDSNAASSMSGMMCEMDFDQFTAELESMGFTRTLNYGEHNRHMGDIFSRSGLRIEVYLRGEASQPIEKISHDCVDLITVF